MKALVFANNVISLKNAKFALDYYSISYKDVCVFLLRPNSIEWLTKCSEVITIQKASNSYSLKETVGSTYSYLNAIRTLKNQLSKESSLEHIFLVNIDNILTNHALNFAKKQDISVSVIAEGIMNYQDITIHNRPIILQYVKKIISFLTGLTFKIPENHLSGAYESVVKHVFADLPTGIKAPGNKIIKTQTFDEIDNKLENNNLLILLPGLCKLMPLEKYKHLCKRFTEILNTIDYRDIYVKEHPRINDDPLISYLPDFKKLPKNRPIEDIIKEIPVKYILSMCSTALATIKQMNSEYVCIDIGANYYCNHAYKKDYSVINYFKSADVKVIDI